MISVPVLMYHHISNDREVGVSGFKSHLLYLKGHGYRSVSLDMFHKHLTGDIVLPDKSVLITFDDGYADNWICAWPILKECGMKAVIFVTTRRLDDAPDVLRPTLAEGAQCPVTRNDERRPEGFVSWKELKRMVSSGVFEAASHTHTHKDFLKRSAYKDIRMELQVSRDRIEKHLGAPPRALAWPWGQFEPEWEAPAREAGYRMAFTVKVGANVSGMDPFYIRRFSVQTSSSIWLASRLWLYRKPMLAGMYSSIYGLDRVVKKKILGKSRK